ncbi:hypothetical protein RJO15_08010 [Herbaspirillum huttiense F1]|uniref:hypothetical protein n=1 Tax=Herbaspirillum huttiense TaxID=863372 RepID=UPI0028879733|nr:hypothetical protein [Herbaspirillum huttiense]MDT0355705.1 hypothetical protein [Herbaspirillum huttiense F1]
MYQIDNATASSTLPAPSSAGTAGYFTDGNPVTGQAPTVVPAEFLNMLMMELVNLLQAAAITPSKADRTQVAAAVRAIAQASQVGVAGQALKLAMSLSSAATSATFTADEIVVESALGGLLYRMAAPSLTLNIAGTGAGGMDTGSAPTSGYVAVYAIYNPITNAKSIIGVNATSAAAPSVYGGANMPAGYTASGLIAVVPTNPSGQFIACNVVDRRLSRVAVTPLAASAAVVGSLTSLSISSAVPPNARRVSGYCEYTNSTAANLSMNVSADSLGIGMVKTSAPISSVGQPVDIPFVLDLKAAQTVYYQNYVSSGTPSYTLAVNAYEI